MTSEEPQSKKLAVCRPEDGLTSWTSPGSLAAVSAATAATAVGAFPAAAAFVAGGSAPPAAFAYHSPSVYPLSRALRPASAGVCLVPVAASQLAYPAAAGTSCPASGCPYLECSLLGGEGRGDGQPCSVERRCSLNAPDFRHDWPEYKALLLLWPAQRHGH